MYTVIDPNWSNIERCVTRMADAIFGLFTTRIEILIVVPFSRNTTTRIRRVTVANKNLFLVCTRPVLSCFSSRLRITRDKRQKSDKMNFGNTVRKLIILIVTKRDLSWNEITFLIYFLSRFTCLQNHVYDL